ncbi:MAG: sigma-70 family RNA polymerase sigma factor [Bacteroidales bacterium]|nr:sigma-70 family RNA polymerase sigma factor [Bacteroidales bacterium]
MKDIPITQRITYREELSFDKYLSEINREALLSPEEEVELVRRLRQNDKEAFEKLIRCNLRFVISVAKQYQYQGLSLADLINEGNLGLIKAVRRFDETKGFKFITYAVWWIRQSILQALAENARIVRLPVNKIGFISKVNKAFSELEQKHQREPSPKELSRVLGWSAEKIDEARQLSYKHLSMDAPLDGEEEDSLYDIIKSEDNAAPDEHLMKEALTREVERALSSLTTQEATIIKLYYGIGNKPSLPLGEIGKQFNLSSERTRQLKNQALEKLRQTSSTDRLKSYIG